MAQAEENAVNRALAGLAPSGVHAGCRRIRRDDEQYLLPAERASREPRARDASGAGRRIAHELLERLGHAGQPILRGRMGEPVWPAGIVGSIAHDDTMAIAVAARADAVRSVGVDIEPALPLPADLRSVVVIPEDHLGDFEPGIGGRVLFAVKEAAYKASFPLDGQILEFEDIAVDLAAGAAVISSGRRMTVRFTIRPRVLALAYTI